ncbi:MAG: isocitrate lyase [Legionellales bacterium]|nr:isocitrate lyase [Legionellales bacterium]|tara:strand:- start:48878 stop:49726 length:849 start_codon:yes stop_codon:yes gene_type:complete
MSLNAQLHHLIHSDELIIAPGAFDGLSARLVEQAGFNAIYASGGAIARSCGFPDIGLISFAEVCSRLQHMVEVTNTPIIADADTGFGNVINVQRTVKTFERIGVSALHLEDQVFPKRCGHLDNKTLVSTDEMVQKIKVAKDAQHDPHFTVIARTDAIAVEGFEPALERAQHYVEAGADMIFVEAPQSEEHIELIAKHIKAPKLINMFYGGKTPLVPTDKLQALGYRVVIIPSDLQRAAIHSMQMALQAIKQHGDSASVQEQLVSFNEREAIIDTTRYLKLDK